MSESTDTITPVSLRELADDAHVESFYAAIIGRPVAGHADLPELTQKFVHAARHDVFAKETAGCTLVLRSLLQALLIGLDEESEAVADVYTCGQRKYIIGVFNDALRFIGYPCYRLRYWEDNL